MNVLPKALEFVSPSSCYQVHGEFLILPHDALDLANGNFQVKARSRLQLTNYIYINEFK